MSDEPAEDDVLPQDHWIRDAFQTAAAFDANLKDALQVLEDLRRPPAARRRRAGTGT